MKIAIVGFGVVGQALVRLLRERSGELYRRHGFAPRIVAAIDTRGAALSAQGLDMAALLRTKASDGTVATLPDCGVSRLDNEQVIAECGAHVLVEATPSSLRDPQPAIRHLKAAFRAGLHVVSVNKVPLAVAFPGLRELADYNRVMFRFSGTVGAGLPVLALAQQCALGDEILSVRAVLNGTTNYILWRMHEAGLDFAAALAEAVRLGYAETDPSADVDGVDTAMKTVIFANVVLDRAATLADVQVAGIRDLPRERIATAAAAGRRVKLLAELGEKLRVGPQEIEAHGPLDVPANLNAVSLSLRHGGEVTLRGPGAGGVETATGVLRDLLDIWHALGSAP